MREFILIKKNAHYFVLALTFLQSYLHSSESTPQLNQNTDSTEYLLQVHAVYKKIDFCLPGSDEQKIYQEKFNILAARTRDDYHESRPYFHNGRILDWKNVSEQMEIAKEWRRDQLIKKATAAYSASLKQKSESV